MRITLKRVENRLRASVTVVKELVARHRDEMSWEISDVTVSRSCLESTLFFETLPRSYINCERDRNEHRNHANTFIYILWGDNTRNYIHTCIELERDTWIDNEWKPRSLRMRTRKRTRIISFYFSKNWWIKWENRKCENLFACDVFFLWNVVIAYFLPTFASFLIRFALRNNC